MKKLFLFLFLCTLTSGCALRCYGNKASIKRIRKIYPYKTIWDSTSYSIIKISEHDFIHVYKGFWGLEYKPLVELYTPKH